MNKYNLWIFLLLNFYLHAQNPRIDSLKNELSKDGLKDAKRFEILNSISLSYVNFDTEKGLYYAEEALKIALKLKDKKFIAQVYRSQAFNYEKSEQYDLGIEAYTKYLRLQKELNNWTEAGKGFFNRSILQYNLENYSEALQSIDSAYNYFGKDKDTILMAVALNSKGINYMNLNFYPQATKSYLEALMLFENSSLKNSSRQAQTYNNLGILHKRIEDYDTALDYHNKALSIHQKNDEKYSIANNYSGIGVIYDLRKESEKALEFHDKSLLIMLKLNNTYGIASAYTNKGIAFSNLKVFDSSEYYLKKGIDLWKQTSYTSNLAVAYDNLASNYYDKAKQGINKKTNLQLALLNFNKSHAIAEELDNHKRIFATLENRSKVFVEQGDFKNAYFDKQKSNEAKEKYLASAKKDTINFILLNNEFEKKELKLNAAFEKEQAKKEAELENQKVINTTMTIGSLAVLGFVIFGFVSYKRKESLKKKNLKTEFNLKISEVEQKVLRSRMDPHFLANSLSSINAYFENNDNAKASEYVIKFSKLMRQILEYSTEDEILLEQEITILKNYLDIENLRLNQKFEYNFSIDSKIDIDNILLPPMILQPFVENSIKYGIIPVDYKGKIEINYKIENQMLVCCIADNGKGITKSSKQQSEHTSLSTEITKQRLEIIDKLKNTNTQLTIQPLEKGTQVTVTLPISYKF